MGASPRRARGVRQRVPRTRLGDDLQLIGQRERVELAHVLVETHPHGRRSVFIPTLMSRRMTGSASGFSSFSRSSSAVVTLSSPIDAVPRRTSVPSRFTIDRGRASAGVRICQDRPHLLAFEHGISVVRGNVSGLEPSLSPQPLAQRRELAEVRRPFDRAALETEFLRGRVVVNRRVGIGRSGHAASGAAGATARPGNPHFP